MNFNKLEQLVHDRSVYCDTQSKLFNNHFNIGLVEICGYHSFTKELDSDLERFLKDRAKEFCVDKINELNKQIEELCKWE